MFLHLPFQKVKFYYLRTKLHGTAVFPSVLFPKYGSLKQNTAQSLTVQGYEPPTTALNHLSPVRYTVTQSFSSLGEGTCTPVFTDAECPTDADSNSCLHFAPFSQLTGEPISYNSLKRNFRSPSSNIQRTISLMPTYPKAAGAQCLPAGAQPWCKRILHLICDQEEALPH